MRLGLRVIALTGKMPNGQAHKHGLKDCYWWPDPEGMVYGNDRPVEAAFNHPKTTGVAILTGPVYYVVDIDGPAGAEQWNELVGPEEAIIDGWVAKTGRGLHLWVASTEQWPTAKLGEKLDFKGVGGYVAAPPSLHPEGHRYEWLVSPSEGYVKEMPLALEQELQRRAFDRERGALTRAVLRQTSDKPLVDGKLYAVATFDGIIERMRSEPEGNRNAVLYWAARTMLEEGADDEDLEELLDAATGAGLSRRESRRTIRSAAHA